MKTYKIRPQLLGIEPLPEILFLPTTIENVYLSGYSSLLGTLVILRSKKYRVGALVDKRGNLYIDDLKYPAIVCEGHELLPIQQDAIEWIRNN